MADAYLLIGIEPGEQWPLVPQGEKFNGEVTAWTVFTDETKAEEKCQELNESDDHITEWQVIPRRVA